MAVKRNNRVSIRTPKKALPDIFRQGFFDCCAGIFQNGANFLYLRH
jgi:hypothetical protein